MSRHTSPAGVEGPRIAHADHQPRALGHPQHQRTLGCQETPWIRPESGRLDKRRAEIMQKIRAVRFTTII